MTNEKLYIWGHTQELETVSFKKYNAFSCLILISKKKKSYLEENKI